MWVFDGGLEKDDERQSFLDMKIDNPNQLLKSFGICVRLLLDDLFPQCVFEETGFKFIFLDGNRNYGCLRLYDDL